MSPTPDPALSAALASPPGALVLQAALLGAGATALLDLWLLLLQRLGVPTTPFAMIGRWIGHLARGRWRHRSIAQAPALPAERALGWLVHYAVGIAFAGLLLLQQGAGWLRSPTWAPALLLGLATVVMPLFVMQPAMGAGIAASRTATPLRNVLRSIVNHVVFGCGLYLVGLALSVLGR